MRRRHDVDHESATDILAEHSPEFRRDEAMIKLRRELRELCIQAGRSGMTNGEALVVMHIIADLPATIIGAPTSAALDLVRASLEQYADQAPLSRDGVRFVSLAGDAYQDAAKALRKD